jgi:hypothetical protein
MKTTSLLCTVGAVLCLSVIPAALAQTSDGSMLFTPAVDLAAGAQNSYAGNVGGVFLTTSSYWPYVNWLGYYDKDGDGLANSHQVALWKVGGVGGTGSTPEAMVTIPAGTAAPLVNGYRWVQLPSTVGLWYGTWYTLSAQTDGVDTWGDLISAGQVSWGTQYVDAGAGWSRAGRYDSAESWPNSPGTQVGTSDSIYPAGNMAYNLTIVPEPTSLGLIGLGVVAWLGLGRKRGV